MYRINKMDRLIILREDKMMQDVVYKSYNQLRHWTCLRRMRWIIKQSKNLALRGKVIDLRGLHRLLENIEEVGFQVREYIRSSYLLPIMSIFLCIIS